MYTLSGRGTVPVGGTVYPVSLATVLGQFDIQSTNQLFCYTGITTIGQTRSSPRMKRSTLVEDPFITADEPICQGKNALIGANG